MEPLPGFVSIPRPSGPSRPAGAFFSAVVEGSVGPHQWRLRLNGQTHLVTSELELVPGQTLRLRWMGQRGNSWLLQLPAAPDSLLLTPKSLSTLEAAFLAQGLPLAAERLSAWSRWLSRVPGVSNKEQWAASLEAKAGRPGDDLEVGLTAWLQWQAALEAGEPRSAPPDEYWQTWNSRKPKSGDPWLTSRLQWEHAGLTDSGLLQAHWNPQAQRIDQWQLTATPAGVPFRLEASSRRDRLDLTWRFFNEVDRNRWLKRAPELAASLSRPDLKVSLRIEGPHAALPPRGGVDVEA